MPDDPETGEMAGNRSRTAHADGAARRRASRKRRAAERANDGAALRGPREMQAGWAARGGMPIERDSSGDAGRGPRGLQQGPGRIAGQNGSFPASEIPPRPPPILVLYEDLADEFGPPPEPVYGQYPRGTIHKALPWLQCQRHQILHVCSGSLPHGEGTRVDIRPAARPDILADGRKLPFADGSWRGGILIDPPYSAHYARELYGVEYLRPSHLLREAARVLAPGGRVGIVHYHTPKPVGGLAFVKAFGLSIGFDMPMRALTFYERPVGARQVELAEAG